MHDLLVVPNKGSRPTRLKQAIVKWLGFGYTDAASWAAYYGTKSSTGLSVNSERALRLSTVMACARLIAQTIATLPLGFYEKVGEDRKLVHPDLERLLCKVPAANLLATTFWENMILAVLLAGTSAAKIIRLGSRIVSLKPLHPDCLSWQWIGGRWKFSYTDPYTGALDPDIPRSDLFIIPGFSLHEPFGMSLVRYGVEVLGSALAAEKAANATFKNGLMPTVYYYMERILNPKQRDEFRGSLEGLSGAMNAGKSPLLEGGMKADTIGIDPVDAQLLESRRYSAEEICRWFGVPPPMVGAGDKASSWASSSEQMNIWFLQYGLRPILAKVEQAIWSQLFTDRERSNMYAEFAVEGLLRADLKSRTAFYASALQNGYMNRNLVARLENFPPPPGGDIYTVQSNLLPLEKVGQNSAEPTPAADPATDAADAVQAVADDLKALLEQLR